MFQKETEYDPATVLWGSEGPPPSCSCDDNSDTKDCPNKFRTSDVAGTQCNDYYKSSEGIFAELAGAREYIVEA